LTWDQPHEAKFGETQIVNILKEAEAGIPMKEMSWKHGLSKSPLYKIFIYEDVNVLSKKIRAPHVYGGSNLEMLRIIFYSVIPLRTA
jgi:hypothetical protein